MCAINKQIKIIISWRLQFIFSNMLRCAPGINAHALFAFSRDLRHFRVQWGNNPCGAYIEWSKVCNWTLLVSVVFWNSYSNTTLPIMHHSMLIMVSIKWIVKVFLIMIYLFDLDAIVFSYLILVTWKISMYAKSPESQSTMEASSLLIYSEHFFVTYI